MCIKSANVKGGEIRLATTHAPAAKVKMHQHRDVTTKTHSNMFMVIRFYICSKFELRTISDL